MNDINSIGFALDPKNVPSFLLDWELTKLCNLDCSYCPVDTVGYDGGHDNSTQHPPLAECLQSIDFMYEYVDLYMQYKKPSQRKVVLNVYGGESLFHPDIVEILEQVRERYKPYRDRWYLTVTCTTNGIVGQNHWQRIVPLIDEFTMSYHPENLPKQKQQFKDNVLYLKRNHLRFKTVVMMHNDTEYFKDSVSMVEFCKEHKLRHVAKPLDNWQPEWQYTGEQYNKLKTFWMTPVTEVVKDRVQAIDEGRACCGGRRLSLNGDLKSNVNFVTRQGFRDWSCSVNWFFLFVQQLTGLVYTNKDCKVSTTGRVEPLGSIQESSKIIDTLCEQLESKTLPIIKCVKETCRCGFCAPKAQDPAVFRELIFRNVIEDVFTQD
jgi:hypothetical protein